LQVVPSITSTTLSPIAIDFAGMRVVLVVLGNISQTCELAPYIFISSYVADNYQHYPHEGLNRDL
jgi:hypothetical protein